MFYTHGKRASQSEILDSAARAFISPLTLNLSEIQYIFEHNANGHLPDL